MKKSKGLFSQLHKKAILYGLVDEGGWFSQVLASRKTAAKYTKLTKISAISGVFIIMPLHISPCVSKLDEQKISTTSSRPSDVLDEDV
jgi:hypothetical protein